jgi:ligand-binding SRPBCC domain-containing protein
LTVIEVVTDIAASPARCFDLARDVETHLSSLPQSNERATAGKTSGLLDAGDEVTFEARHFGIPWKLTALVTEFDPPTRFVDEMQRGPFKSWRHEHRFVSNERGTTRMVDVADYTPPGGPIGAVVDRVFLRRYMHRLLEERGHHIKLMAESA